MVGPSIRGSVALALRTELVRLVEEAGRGPAELPPDSARWLAEPIDPVGWQPLAETSARLRDLAVLVGPSRVDVMREVGRRISRALVKGEYELNEDNRDQWGVWLGNTLVQLAPALIDIGRWEFELVRPLREGIIHAHDVTELTDVTQAVCEGVIEAVAGRILNSEVEVVAARPTRDYIEFRFRVKNRPDRPSVF